MELKSNIASFFSDISNFFRGGRAVGIDIGTVSIKMAELSKKGEDIVLENYGILETKGYLERGNEAIQTSSLKLVEADVIKVLKILLNEVKPKSRNVVASLPNFASFTTSFEIPVMPPEETAKVVGFQAKQYIPVPIAETTLEWIKTEEFENQKGQSSQRILVTAVPNELIRKYRTIFKGVGLNLTALEVESSALVRALTNPDSLATLIIDIGAESTNFIIAEKGLLRYSGQSDYAGASLTQAVARSLDISAFRAEELKCRRGLLGSEGEYELSTSLLPFLDVIIQEAGRVMFDYERIYKKKVERLMLVGGGANLPGIQDYFSGQTKLILNEPLIFSNIKYRTELEPVVKDLNRTLAISVGLALRIYI